MLSCIQTEDRLINGKVLEQRPALQRLPITLTVNPARRLVFMWDDEYELWQLATSLYWPVFVRIGSKLSLLTCVFCDPLFNSKVCGDFKLTGAYVTQAYFGLERRCPPQSERENFYLCYVCAFHQTPNPTLALHWTYKFKTVNLLHFVSSVCWHPWRVLP